MKITSLVAQAILAASALAAPFHPPTFKNQSREAHANKNGEITPGKPSVTRQGFIASLPRFPRETTATHLPFNSHPDALESFRTVTSYHSWDDRQKNKTNATLSKHHHSPTVSYRIPKHDAALTLADLDLVYEELLHFFKVYETNHTKRSESQIEQALNLIQSLNATRFSDERKAQRVINQLQADLEMYRPREFNSPKEQINAIKEPEYPLHHLNFSRDSILNHSEKLPEAREKRIGPQQLIYPILVPNAGGQNSWNEKASDPNNTSHFWSDASKLSEKRAVNQSSYDDFSESQSPQNPYPATDPALSDDAKLDKGRECLDNVRAYLDDQNKVYPTNESLPLVFDTAWKVITKYGLPMKFKKAYMDMVKEYLMSASHQPRYAQDGSGRAPADIIARDNPVRRQEEPTWLKKFISLEVDNTLLRRESGHWLDDGMAWDLDEDPQNDETVYFDVYTEVDRALPGENNTENPSPEERLSYINGLIYNHTHSESKRSLSGTKKNVTLSISHRNGINQSSDEQHLMLDKFVAGLKSQTSYQANHKHTGWERDVSAGGETDLSRDDLQAFRAYINEASFEVRNQAHALQLRTLNKSFKHGNSRSKRSSVLSIDGEEAYKRFHAKSMKNTKSNRRQTAEDGPFSQHESAEAFQRYVMELEQEQDPRNGYQPHEMSAAEQDKIRTQLREMAEKSSGTATMKIALADD